MPLYEHVMIARQDLSAAQAEELFAHFGKVLADNGGTVTGTEYWGLRTLAYKIKKNRKGHYGFFRIDSPPEAMREMERLMGLHEDVMRGLTVKVNRHGEGPSPVAQAKSARDERDRERGGRSRRDDRDRDRDRGRDRDVRDAKEPREARDGARESRDGARDGKSDAKVETKTETKVDAKADAKTANAPDASGSESGNAAAPEKDKTGNDKTGSDKKDKGEA